MNRFGKPASDRQGGTALIEELASYDRASMIAIYATINVIVFFCGILVLLMQPGFMLLETGSLSRKNALNNIFKNFVDLCICGVFFYFVGYPILAGASPLVDLMVQLGLAREAVPPAPGAVINISPDIKLFFNFVFAATAATITSGAVTGRIAPTAYLIFGAVFAGFVYPVVAFTVWNPQGMLYGVYSDFAGSSVVHAVGGFAGLAGAIMLGARIGEFGHGKEHLEPAKMNEAIRGTHAHNMPLTALGVFLMWIGWYGMNAGSVFSKGYDMSRIDLTGVELPKEFAETVFNNVVSGFGQVIVNTTLAPCAGVFVVFVFFVLMREKYYMTDMLNGALAGLVGVAACAEIVSPTGALLVGMICAGVYVISTLLMVRLQIDDPVSAFSVHGAAGLAAVTLRGVLDDSAAVVDQAIFGAGIAAFAFVSATITFMLAALILRIYKAMTGSPHRNYAPFRTRHLRVSPQQEIDGLDWEIHGERAYGPESR